MVAGRRLPTVTNGAVTAGSLGCEREKREREKRGGRKGYAVV
jgi:hypothetical protein